MKKPLLLCALFIGLLGALWFVQRRREKMTAVILSHYARDIGIAHVIDEHLHRERYFGVFGVPTPVLLTTDFESGNGDCARWYDMQANGISIGYQENISSNRRNHFSMPVLFSDGGTQLSTSQLEWAKDLLKNPPENQVPQSRYDLVMVSFGEGKEWRTQVYDKKALPASIKRLLTLLGNREIRP